ncbi:hypothetical protein ACFYXV_29065 [Streptomyces sp. NPDC002181]
MLMARRVSRSRPPIALALPAVLAVAFLMLPLAGAAFRAQPEAG